MRGITGALIGLALAICACTPHPSNPPTQAGTPASDATPATRTLSVDKIDGLLLNKDEINALRPNQSSPLITEFRPYTKPWSDDYSYVWPKGCFNLVQTGHADIFGDKFVAYREIKLGSQPDIISNPTNVVTERVALYSSAADASAAFGRLRDSLNSCGDTGGEARQSDYPPQGHFRVTPQNVTETSARWTSGWTGPDYQLDPRNTSSYSATVVDNALIEVSIHNSNDGPEASTAVVESIAKRSAA